MTSERIGNEHRDMRKADAQVPISSDEVTPDNVGEYLKQLRERLGIKPSDQNLAKRRSSMFNR